VTRPDYDLVVIGAGSGGVRAARIAAGHGARVLIAEADRIGGTCVIRGCVPKKLFVYASRYADALGEMPAFGFDLPTEGVRFDWSRLRDNVAAEVTRLSGLYRKGLEGAGVAIAETRATVAGPNTVQLADGRSLAAGAILVATGGWPSIDPAIDGAELAITSADVFHLPALPKRMVVTGGGFIALEFASVFARLGVAVTLVHRGVNVLRGFDEDIRLRIRDALVAAGVALELGTTIRRIARGAGETRQVHLANGTLLAADAVLIATGRLPNTGGLGLAEAGVALAENGAVKVDAESRSNVPSIYAVGDVTDRVNLTPVAIREGHAFADTVFGNRRVTVDHAGVPAAVFTTPEIGVCGMTEAAARARGEIVLFKSEFRPMKATLAGKAARTFMKLVVDKASDRLLGCHILGDDAAEMIQLIGVVIKMGGRKSDLDATMALHPSAAEELVTMRTPWTPPKG
jgi:glutathione reductase (NADPH)